ncbi:unnamed protein product [Effrenium voratum]|nr:unnamed protein product [Effrenium voratum]
MPDIEIPLARFEEEKQIPSRAECARLIGDAYAERYLQQLGVDGPTRWAKAQVLKRAPLTECQIEAAWGSRHSLVADRLRIRQPALFADAPEEEDEEEAELQETEGKIASSNVGFTVAVVFQGSRGDSQPYVVAAKALQDAGYEVLVVCPQDMAAMAEAQNLRCCKLDLSAREITTSPAVVKAVTENDFLKIAAATKAAKSRAVLHNTQVMMKDLSQFQPELILAAALGLSEHIAVAKALGDVPFILLAMQVIVPSNYINVLGVLPRLPRFLNLNLRVWRFIVSRSILGKKQSSKFLEVLEGICKMPKEALQVSWAEFAEHCSCDPQFPIFFAVSRRVQGPFPPDFNELCRELGPLTFQSHQEIGADFGDHKAMEDFLANAEAPVYLGYGSMVCRSGKYMTLLSLRALRRTGQRGVVASGWAGMSLTHLEGEEDAAELEAYCKEKVLFMDDAPHAKLFPRCSVLVHHGGAGTLYAAALSGVPSVVVPVLLDQYVHCALVKDQHIGVGLKAMKTATPEALAEAITTCLESPQIRASASSLAHSLREEDGSVRLVAEVKSFFREFVDTGLYQQKKQSLRERRKTLLQRIREWLPCPPGRLAKKDG